MEAIVAEKIAKEKQEGQSLTDLKNQNLRLLEENKNYQKEKEGYRA